MERQDYPRPRVATNKEIDEHALDVIQELEEMIMALKNDSSMTWTNRKCLAENL